MAYNIVYIGSSAKICDYIHCEENLNVTTVICQDLMLNDDLLNCVYLRDIKLIEIKNYQDLKLALNDAGTFDFCIMGIFGMILKKDILDKYKFYNIHTSYLPYYKGKNPTFHATMTGEKRVGISLHEVTADVDHGSIISRKMIPYYFWMDDLQLWDQLLEQVPALLRDLKLFLNNDNYATIPNTTGYYFPAVTPAMTEITADTRVKDIQNLMRTQKKYRGATLKYNEEVYRIKNATVVPMSALKGYDFEVSDRLILINNQPAGIKTEHNHFLRFEDIEKD